MSTNEMSAKVRELKELQQLIEEATAEAEAIKDAIDAIKAEMEARSVEEMTVDVFKVRWKKVTSSRIDTTALKKALPELAQQFTKKTESRRFSIA